MSGLEFNDLSSFLRLNYLDFGDLGFMFKLNLPKRQECQKYTSGTAVFEVVV